MVNTTFQFYKMMRLRLLLFFVLCHLIGFAQGTCFLVLKHNEIGKRNFYPGSEIEFKLANVWYHGTIDSLNQDNFFLGEVPIPTRQIQAVKVYRKTFNYLATGSALITGGLFLDAVYGINYVGSKGKNPLSNGPLIMSTSAIILGLVMLPFNSRTYEIGERNKLVMICL